MAARSVTLQVSDGLLRGQRDRGVSSFKGVPYAADTAGRNRFRAPQPVQPWSGERDATGYGPLGPQIKTGMGSAEILEWYDQPEPIGEDCCVLNVFTSGTDPAARRPVMVYIHGGGYINGGGGPALVAPTSPILAMSSW